MSNYIVVADHPYYPEVEYFDNIEDARQRAEDFKNELFDSHGYKDCEITIASVQNNFSGKSTY